MNHETSLYADLSVHGSLTFSEEVFEFPNTPKPGQIVYKDGVHYAYRKISESTYSWTALGPGAILAEQIADGTLSPARLPAFTGDVTSLTGSSILTLANSGVTAGTYNNSATQVTPLIVDGKGRITGTGNAITITPAWANVTGKPTTLAGYGITDAASSSHNHTGTYQPIDADLTAIAGLSGTSGFLKKTAANTWALDTNSYLTSNQNITVTGDATGSGATSIAITLANSGVTEGTYSSVTVDGKGRVTAGTNPTTLSGYGITDAAPSSHVGATGSAHGTATTSVAGFMSAADKTKLDGIAAGANAYTHPTGDGNLHVPATGTTNNGKVLTAGATAGSLSWTIPLALGTTAGSAPGTASAGTATTAAKSDHVHPLQTSVSGNAGTATKLATARTINGVSFDGTANITINAVDSTERIATSEKGVANGVATLDSSGLVPSSQLPSYVDDVLEYANLAGFPATGETAKIYVALDTNKIYRWSGSAYIEVSPTAGNADSATKLATARTIQLSGGVTGAGSFDGTANVNITTTVGNDSHTHSFANLTSKPTTLSGYGITDAAPSNHVGATGAAHGTATTSVAGFMSAADKTKLDGIASGANAYTLPIATSSVLGGVKDGTGVTIDASGVISVDYGSAAGTAVQGNDARVTADQAAGIASIRTIGTGALQAAAGNHTHNYAGSTSAGGAANSVANSITVKFDSGTTEGTDLYTFNGSAARAFDIKAGTNISLTKAAGVITINANDTSVAWTEITSKPTTLSGYGIADAALASHTHDYLPLSGGTLTGAVTFAAGQTWPTFNQSTSGNAATATKLATARNINGVAFDGSANINLQYVSSYGDQTVNTANRVVNGSQSGLFTYGYYNTNGPTAYGEIVSFGQGTAGQSEIAVSWSGPPQMFVRSLRDTTDNWSDWREVAFTNSNITGSAGSVAWSGVTSKPTTLAGYGITDAVSSGHVGATGTAHGTATTSVAGFMSSADKTKLDGIAAGANAYTHPTTDGNLHVPATGTTNNGKVLVAGSTAGSMSWATLDLSFLPDAAFKKSVRVATTANITLSGLQTIDGITVVANDRILVKDQTTAAANGIYLASASTWSRAADADTATKIAGATVNVDSGTANGGLRFDTDFKTTDTLGTTAMTWARVVDTNLASSTTPAAAGTATIGTSITYARADHVHPLQTTITGNAATATKLATGRTIGMTGDVAWTSSAFDGSANVTGTATLANSGVAAGTYKSVTVDAKGRVTSGTNPTTLAGYGITDAAASSHTHDYLPLAGGTLTGGLNVNNATLVSGSHSGLNVSYTGTTTQYGITLKSTTAGNTTAINFFNSAGANVGSITQTDSAITFNGTATSASSVAWSGITGKPTTLAGYGITDAAAASHTHSYLPLAGGTLTGLLVGRSPQVVTSLSLLTATTPSIDCGYATVPNSGTQYAPMLHGRSVLSGAGYIQHVSIGHKRSPTAWGDFYIAVGGNDSYPTKEWLFNGGTGNTVMPGTVTASMFTGDLSGNASTATKLATARTINGVAFDGSANITVPASGGNADTVDNLHASSFFRSDTSNFSDVRLSSTDGQGVRFWDNEAYKIYMSSAGNAVHGGRISTETSSDYNIYFRLAGGTNRGFIFETDYSNKLFSINPDGIRSSVTMFAPQFSGALTGNASTATALKTGRTITMTGDVAWISGAFDGTANVTGVSTLSNTGVTAGTYNDNATQVRPFTVDAKGRLTSIGSAVTITPAWASITSKPTTIAGYGITDAMAISRSAATFNTAANGWYRIASSAVGINRNSGVFVVDWAVSGQHGAARFAAGCHYGDAAGVSIMQENYSFFGTAGITEARVVYHTSYTGNYAHLEVKFASALTSVAVSVEMQDGLGWSLVAPNTAGSVPSGYSSYVHTFVSSGQIAAGTYKSVTVNQEGRVISGSNPTTLAGYGITDALSASGNAGSATKLQTARNINGTAFDGTADIVTSYWGTARTINGTSVNGSSNYAIGRLYDSAYRRITNPGGGEFSTSTAITTGAIAITLPVGYTSTMVRMTIKIYDYTLNESFEVHAGGYNYGSGTWVNSPFAYIIGNPSMNRQFTIRFGHDTTTGKSVIYIGELTSNWSYLQVFVTEVQCGFSGNSEAWTTGWSIGAESSSFKNVTATIENCQVGYAVSTNTPNSNVLRDASGNFSANIITASLVGSVTGNASTASKLETPRYISMSGDVSWTSGPFDGSASVAGTSTLSNTGVTAGTYNNSSTQITPFTVDAKGRITGTGAAVTITPAWSSITGKPTTLAGYGITDALSSSGNAGSATKLQTARTINGTAFDGTANIVTAYWGTARTLTIGSTGKAIDGSANVSWSLAEIGAAAINHDHNGLLHRGIVTDANTVLTEGTYGFGAGSGLANFPWGAGYGKLIVTVNDGTTHNNSNNWIWQEVQDTSGRQYARYKVNSSAWTAWVHLRTNGNWEGNAATAAALQTARNINGTSFNGTADIVTSYWGSARTLTIGNTGKSVNGSANVSWSLAEIGAASAAHTHVIADVAGLQAALDACAKLAVAQTFTAAQRGTIFTNNTVSFNLSQYNNFACTPTASGTLTFTNLVAGQSGFIRFVNNSNYLFALHSSVKASVSFASTISTTGTHVISYFCDGTNVFVSVAGDLV